MAKATLLNQHFASCFTSTSSPEIVHPSPSASVQSREAKVPPGNPCVVICDQYNVLQLLGSLGDKKVTGPDGIPGKVLRACAASISPTLTILFNLTCDWRTPSRPNVVPVFKSGDESVVSNYRPISLLSITSKMSKRLIHNPLLSYVKRNSLLSSCQFGFRPRSSSKEALPCVCKYFL